MARNQVARFAALLAPTTIVACTLSLVRMPGYRPTPQASTTVTLTSQASATSVPRLGTTEAADPTAPTATRAATAAATPFCQDQKPRSVITQFKAAVLNSDGPLLASLVSPDHGMDARLFRDGRIVNYDRPHAAALFDSTFELNWGIAPGSGQVATGSFRDLLVPDLRDVLARDFTMACNEIRVGGTTYAATWPYAGIDFYSLYVPGTSAYGEMDWHTWLLGMHYVGGDPFLYAIMQFKWEP